MFSEHLRPSIIFVHRWLGVVLSCVFLVWFLSGVGLMYWDFPSVRDRDRLERMPALDASTIRLSPSDAAARAGRDQWAPVLLTTFDGRPVYRFGSRRQRSIVYADTGELQGELSKTMIDGMASRWSGQPVALARVEAVDDVDQWTLQVRLDEVKPLWKYAWPDGQQVYVSQRTGEIVQFTTTASRWGAYVGAIPHWLYFTPLRKHARQWSRLVIWASGLATATAMLGLVIAIWTYSPRKRYRHDGVSTAIPYRGWKRWHMIVGVVFGAGAVTWAFSGMLSMDPLPAQRAGGSEGRSHGERVLQSLRGRVALSAFAPKSPGDALRELAPLRGKELELTSFVSDPIYLATVSVDDTRVVSVRGAPQPAFDLRSLIDVLEHAAQASGGGDVSVLDHYDRYYLDRRRTLPLPVVLVRLHDAQRTRLYIDPTTARLAGSYNSERWINRWLYHGLHSLDFPWLYAYRPLWDVVMLTFMVGGTALCLTAVILASKVVTRKLTKRSVQLI